MTNPNDHFENDDYSELHAKYFKDLRESRDVYADPSGWTDTFSNVGLVEKKYDKRLQLYYCDLASNQLKEIKLPILKMLSSWDACEYNLDHVTLCHSTTVGSITVLSTLYHRGIKNIIFETPNYFATHYQAETLGMDITLIPTFFNHNFEFQVTPDFIKQKSPCVVWLTQPRTALGHNQNPDALKQLISNLSPADYLVIDEATEQIFPSVLNEINPEKYPNVIKIRSVFKGLGVNGLRLAAIIHHPTLRYEMTDEMEVFQGALDIYSLENAVELASDINTFKQLLSVSNQQVINLRKKAQRQALGTNCMVSDIVNGYIGSVIIRFTENGLSRAETREAFLRYCALNKTPVILGSAMNFAAHENMEFVRLNYFSREGNILNALKLFADFQC